jgi:SAM-dependent methyltransferase
MISNQPAFDMVGEQFIGYYNTVRGYVREQLTRRNLEPYLGTTAMNIVDVGGGDARDAIWLARQSHNITVVDPSSKMLQEGQKNLDAIDSLVSGKIELVEGTAASIQDQKGNFDMVLSHGVLMYDLKNPRQHVKELVNLAHPTGTISLLTKGYGGSATRLIAERNFKALSGLKRHHQVVNNLGERVWAFEPFQIENLLHKAGAMTLRWSGVRIASESLKQPISDFSEAELEAILGIEEQLGHDPYMRGMGQMLHFIAIRS